MLFDIKFNDEFSPPIKIQPHLVFTAKGWGGSPDRKLKCICSSGKSVPIINETAPGFNGRISIPFKSLFDNFKFSVSSFCYLN